MFTRNWMRLVAITAGLACGSTSMAGPGSTPGSFTVSAGGAATYSVPIRVPSGPRGVAPNLTLQYNSQAENGVVGVGWSLPGLPSIERCPKTVGQDGVAAAVGLTMSDRFCLNGNRLQVTGADSSYGLDGATYQTEIADFSLITSYGSSGNGPAYFTARSKEGLTYEYGLTTDSRVFPMSATTPLRWKLDKISDRDGNTLLTVTYNNSNGHAVPSKISWAPTSAGSTSYLYSAEFAYSSTRSDKDSQLGFVAGFRVENRSLLTGITIKSASGGAARTVKRYVLTPEPAPQTGLTRLKQIQECADDAASDCLTPTVFGYQNGQNVNATVRAGASSSGTVSEAFFDLNGDGRQDIIYTASGTRYVLLANATGYSAPIAAPTASTYVVDRFMPDPADGFLVDVGGTWWYYTLNGTSFSGQATNAPVPSAITRLVADVNGDGLMDLVWMDNSYNVYIRLNVTAPASTVPTFSTTATFAIQLSGTNAFGTWHAGALYARQTGFGLRRLDVDGDGRQDLAAVAVVPPTGVGPPSIYALSLVSNGTTLSLGSGSWAPVQANVGVNFNGDACTDRLVGTTVYVAKCKDTSDTTVSVPGTAVLTMDWDRDGKTDVLVNNGGTLGVYRSTGTGFSALESTSIPYSASSSYLATDQDGDGTEDILKIDNAAPYAISFFTRNSSGSLPAFVLNVPDLLTTVTDGYGVVNTIGYVSTAQSNYTPGTQTQAPLQDVANPIIVVGQVTISDGIGGSYSKRYTYAGARLNKDRQTSAGFERITEFDLRTPFSVSTSFEQVFPLAGMISERSTYQPNGTTLVSRIKNTNSSVALDAGAGRQRYFVYVSNSVADTFTVDGAHLGDPLARVDSTFEYSGSNSTYGNLSGITRVAKDMRSQETWTTTLTNTYQPVDTTNWCIGLPYSIKVERSHAGTTVVTSSARFTEDDPLKCRNRVRTDAPDDPRYKVTTEFGFDSFGNANRSTVTGTNPDGSAMASRITSVDWGQYGIYPSTLTNALSQVTRIDYNYDIGLPKTLWDPNSTAARELKTEWKYDTFGRLTQELRSDQTRLDVVYAACQGACVNAQHQMTVTATDSTAHGVTLSQQIMYLDQFERPIVVRTKLPESTGLYQWRENRYDSRGRLDKQNIPCSTSSPTSSCTAFWVQNRFDDFGRILEASSPRSETDSTPTKTIIGYDGLTRTITDALGSTRTHTFDVNGWLRTSQDANGYQQVFDYDPAGSLTSVTDASTTLFWAQYEYGVRAFQTASYDSGSKNSVDFAGAPNRTRTYNSLGEAVQWSDSKGKVFNAQYDPISRLKKIIEPDSTGAPGTTVDWIWGSDANATNIGRLQSVSSTQTSGVYSEAYIYDSLGRPYTTTINIPGDGSYTYDYRYDSDLGLLQTMEYPTTTSGYRLKLQFDYLYGTLNSIKDAQTSASPFWSMDAINARGQVTQESFGNGIITKSTIDSVNGRLVKLLSGTTADETLVQNSGFLYDAVGDVIQRQQNRRLLTEDFHYDTNPNDQLQRLDSVQVRSGSTVTQNLGMDYYPDGRIKTRTDLTDVAPVDYSVVWDSGNYPVSITAGTQNVQFAYGPDRQRWKTQYQDSAAGRSETTYSIGPFLEKVVTSSGTRYRHTIPAGAGAVALYERSGAGQVLRYAYTDHQGSIDAITDAAGSVTALASFTPFGTRRSATDWVSQISDSERNSLEQITLQGYTYQTALGSMGLNHMNGRVQDALSGTFLSPDPFVPDATNTQDFNRYAYVRNNPLTLTDPSGFDPPYYTAHPPTSPPPHLWDCYSTDSPFGPDLYVPGANNADGTSSTAFVIPMIQLYATQAQCYASYPLRAPTDRHLSTADTMVGGTLNSARSLGTWGDFFVGMLRGVIDDWHRNAALYGYSRMIESGQWKAAEPLIRAANSPLLGPIDTPRGQFGYDLAPAAQIVAGSIYGGVRSAVGSRVRARVGGGASLSNIDPSDALRIQNAASRTNTTITVVGSRARGTAGALSDWDYVLPAGTSNRTRHSLSSSLPEGPRGLGEPRNQDFFIGPVDTNLPYIVFPPGL